MSIVFSSFLISKKLSHLWLTRLSLPIGTDADGRKACGQSFVRLHVHGLEFSGQRSGPLVWDHHVVGVASRAQARPIQLPARSVLLYVTFIIFLSPSHAHARPIIVPSVKILKILNYSKSNTTSLYTRA